MKTITMITAIFSFLVSSSIANNSKPTTPPVSEFETSAMVAIMPTTPVEADFSDDVVELSLEMTLLAPVTPKVAEFEENSSQASESMVSLSPETPLVADFD